MSKLRFSAAAASLALLVAALPVLAALAQDELPDPFALVRPAPRGTRAPYEIGFSPDGARVYVTEFDEGALGVIERATGKVLAHVPTGGGEPTGLAITPDGKTAVVTNSLTGSVAFIQLATQSRRLTTLPGAPYDVVLSRDGSTAFVSVSQLDQVAVMNVATGEITARWPTGRRPRALALSRDGSVLASGNFSEGSVGFYEVASGRRIGDGPTPAVNLKGLDLFPDGRRAYAVAQRAQNERATETPVGVWSNQAFVVRPNGGRNGDQNIWLDLIGADVAEPDSVVFSADGRTVYMTCGGGHSLQILPVYQGDAVTVKGVGAQPRGLALSPDGAEVWVANHLSNDVAVVDIAGKKVTRRIDLGVPTKPQKDLVGRFLFVSATQTRGGQFSCNSCHPDGLSDGISWKFVHVPDAFGKETNRNVRSLRGEIADTAPFRWTGHDKDVEEFVGTEVAKLLQGPPLTPERRIKLTEFVQSLTIGPNPYRNVDQTMTAPALRGKLLFEGKAECRTCHTGPKWGGQRKGFIGTTPEGVDLDVPHLNGVFDTYPYLHDGRAPTLESIFSKHDPQGKHGRAATLSADELGDLIQFLREL